MHGDIRNGYLYRSDIRRGTGDGGRRGGEGLEDELDGRDGRVAFAVCVCAFALGEYCVRGVIRHVVVGCDSESRWLPSPKSPLILSTVGAGLDRDERSSRPLPELIREGKHSHTHDHHQ